MNKMRFIKFFAKDIMKIKFIDQTFFTLQNFLTSLLIIKGNSDAENIVYASSVFIFLSLNSFFINSIYIEFRLKCRMLRYTDTSNFGYGSILLFLVITINIVCLLATTRLFQSSPITIMCLVSCVTIPVCEAARQYCLNISKVSNGLLIDLFSIFVQLLVICILAQLGQLNSLTVLISWLVPSWILTPFFTTKLFKKIVFADFLRYKDMGFHLGTIENILSALQIWFMLKVLSSFYDSESMAAFVVGITLVRPLSMISTLLRSLGLTEIYSTDRFVRDRILHRFSSVILFCSMILFFLIWIGVGSIFTNSENMNTDNLLYSVILLKTSLSLLYSKSYYNLRVKGNFGRLLIARALEWLTIYSLIISLSPKFDILLMNVFLLLGTLIHFVIIKSSLINFPLPREG